MFPRGYPIAHPDHGLLSLARRTGASSRYTGRGVTIAFIDSGFYPHPDLGSRVLTHVDATTSLVIESRARYREPMWYSWHGQMTTVIACGDGSSSGGLYRGLAPDSTLVLIKVSTPRKQIKEPDILRGLQWLVQNHHRFNVRVVNISVGGDFPSTDPDHPLYLAVRALVSQGLIVVAAGGNSLSSPIVPPNSAPEAITVGGYDDANSLDRTRWTLYTNSHGLAYDGTPKPDILAPAAWIPSPILPGSAVEREARWLSRLLTLQAGDQDGLKAVLREGGKDLGLADDQCLHPDRVVHAYLLDRLREHKIVDSHHQYVGGTSVAAAITSSVVARMLEANSSLTPQMVKAILIRTAKRLPDAPLEHQGAGIISPESAAAEADTLHQSRKTDDEPRVSPLV